MFPYLLRRIANYALLLVIATVLAYFLAATQLNPLGLYDLSNTKLNWDGIYATLTSYNINPNDPVLDRFKIWATGVLTEWDWGVTPKGESVNAIVSRRIWVSVRLVFLGSFIGMGVGTALGAWTATKQYSAADRIITVLSLIVFSTPAMVIALFLKLGAIKANAALGGQVFEFVGEGSGLVGRAQHLLLPTISMSLSGIATYSRYQRNLMLDTLGADYVRTARAKGLRKRQAITRHALRTSLIPMGTYFAFALANLFVGASITETVFTWHGMGEYAVTSISTFDINGTVAVVAFSGMMTLIGALLSDFLVAIIDPRVRVS
ncbi:ABC transporter permease [Actinomyces sp. MRS3W]|uniref:ABC transporter permease n=1 Tax=Actinomyces sp. MRS3W TaxID=2800796 RepID=UPI0028FD4CC7|nr:ABC transporter permease [Actinomyces sp. MRS3W]MDU0348985.1 ABC transporter permease [Actinomyces sp. MRS3W]